VADDAPRATDEVRQTAPAARQSVHGLDGLNFFIANVQTGFGPFIAVYLTAEKWTQVDIGLVLTVSGIVALIGQVPAGALVDAVRSKHLMATIAISAIAGSALALALWPIFPLVLLAEILHGIASCLLGPVIATISLGLVGHRAIGTRLGRNACFASIGSGIAAALMGICGRVISDRAVFVLTALLTVPAMLALIRIQPGDVDPQRIRGVEPSASSAGTDKQPRWHGIIDNRPLLIFGSCVALFHLANAAMLPLVGGALTMRSSEWATVLIAACIVVPQIVVAISSPWVGDRADRWGRRPLLLVGFAALPVRGALLAVIHDPAALVAVQILDGVCGAVLGVLLPLVVADLTRGTGHFSAALGVVGTLGGIGASISSTLGGYLTDVYGGQAAFLALAGLAAIGFLAVWTLMPETRPAGAAQYDTA
jgi:MFS family permease